MEKQIITVQNMDLANDPSRCLNRWVFVRSGIYLICPCMTAIQPIPNTPFVLGTTDKKLQAGYVS